MLVLIGTLLSWIPGVGVLGLVPISIGALLALLGRRAFGSAQRRNVMISIVVLVAEMLTVAVGLVLFVQAPVQYLSRSMPEARLAEGVQGILLNLLVVSVVGMLAIGLPSIFITYALQGRRGQILLVAALAISFGVQTALVAISMPILSEIASEKARTIVAYGDVDLDFVWLENPVGQATVGLQALNAIPALFYAAADYLAWTRIKASAKMTERS